MKALIFNSGLGSRMGSLTAAGPKSMVKLRNGESIFARQLRLLLECGISEVVVTTGPYAEQLQAVAADKQFERLQVTFVPNPVYLETNYIYSMHLAREFLDDDCLILHGDLVFDGQLISKVLADPRPDLACYNPNLPRPEKDFKVRLAGGTLREVSVHLDGPTDHAFQPLYKLSRRALDVWLDQVAQFVDAGNVGVYAENALNEVWVAADIKLLSYHGHLLAEIDTPEDLDIVSAEARLFDFRQQRIFAGQRSYARIGTDLAELGVRHPMIVCGRSSYQTLEVASYLKTLAVDAIEFSGYSSNPTLEQVNEGLAIFRENHCDSIITVGGGSAIDVAKCIKLFSALDPAVSPVEQELRYSPIPHLVVPTTAGTGSESTHFSVVYIDGKKHSIAHDSMLPERVYLDPSVLAGLPPYQLKATVLDAFSQCIESIWARNATDESRRHARAGLRLINDNLLRYLKDGSKSDAALGIIRAANFSGKAINLSQTTAAHAMSYALTSHFGIAHGHAVALCLPEVWQHWQSAMTSAPDFAAAVEFRRAVEGIRQALGASTGAAAIERFRRIVDLMDLPHPTTDDPALLAELAASVNQQRLANSPLPLSEDDLLRLYTRILAPKRPRPPSRQAETDALKDFGRFCSRYRLQYYLTGRTLQDAVVHGALTPWSGEPTVAISRFSYQRLRRLRDQLPAGWVLEDFDIQADRTALEPQLVWRGGATQSPPTIRVRVLERVYRNGRLGGALRWWVMAGLHYVYRHASAPSKGAPQSITARIVRRLRPSSLDRLRRRLAPRLEKQVSGVRTYVDLGLLPGLERSSLPAAWLGKGVGVSFSGQLMLAPVRHDLWISRMFGREYAQVQGIPVVGDYRTVEAPAPEPVAGEPSAEPADPDKPLISVIIPVYNVEQYLPACLDSICSQDSSDYEIIAVNDGSPDGSQAILEDYARRYPDRMTVLVKENGGLSDARNFGLAHARGEYVAFVDSDDLVSPRLVHLMGERARSTGADIVVCRYAEYRDGEPGSGRWMNHLNSYGHSVRERPELLIAAYPYAWNKLYRRSLFTDHGISYPVGQAFEDSATTFNLMLEANRIELVNDRLYFYRVDRADSITNTFDEKFYDVLKSFDRLYGYYEAQGAAGQFSDELAELMRRTAFARVNSLDVGLSADQVEQFVDPFLEAIYGYLNTRVPGWAKNKYFTRQMKNPKYAKSPKYRAMPDLAAMKRYFRTRQGSLAGSLDASAEYSTDELLRMLQHEGLEILLKIDRLCEEHGLVYYLAEGSLLGAVRHGGFIPWDDDLDIAMPRQDYQRFLEVVAHTPGLRLFNEQTYPHYFLSFAKVLSDEPSGFTNTMVPAPAEFQGPAVDVFPLDAGIKESEPWIERRVRKLRDMLLFKVNYMSKATRRKRYRTYLESKLHGFSGLQRAIQRRYQRHSQNPKASYLVNYASSYPPAREKVPARCYGTPRRVEFEGHLLPIPSDWDRVLTTTYGSYLTLPRPEQRRPRHRPRWQPLPSQVVEGPGD